jgi:RNA methyltransferase, TrmH family
LIVSPGNERIRRYRRLRKRNFRYREKMFLVEGMQCVAEALLSPHDIECVMCSERGMHALEAYSDIIRERSIPCYEVSDEVISCLTDTVTPQGVIAVSCLVDVGLTDILAAEPTTILVANRVRDPGNLGNMIRIADAAGAGGLVICAESADPYNPKTVRSTAGSLFHLPFSVGMDTSRALGDLKKAGYIVLATDAHSGTVIWEAEWPERLALVMGNEAWGIPSEEEALADKMVRVPLFGKAESLNVSAATAVLLYEAARQRRER